jgi:hypothetical protein
VVGILQCLSVAQLLAYEAAWQASGDNRVWSCQQLCYAVLVRPCRVANSLVTAYEAVFNLLDDPTAGYAEQGGSAVVKHSPSQVRTILGVL